MMTRIIDLPSSILYKIFRYVPNDILIELIDIPTVSDQASNALYTKVNIGARSRVQSTPELKGTDKIPVVDCVNDIIKLQVKYPMARPKQWVFEESIDVFEEINNHSTLFDDAKDVEIQFSETWNDPQFSSKFCEDYNANPILITSLVDFDLNVLNKITGERIGRYLTSLRAAKFNINNDFDKLSWFSKLTSLTIDTEFSPTQLYQLPRQLTRLKVSLEFHKDDYLEERINNDSLIELDFPKGLRELDVEFAEEHLNSSFFNLDISHLTQLKKLTISTILPSGTNNSYCLWELPKSLNWLSYITYHSMNTPLKIMCPELAFLRVVKAEDSKRMKYIVNDLPETLQELHTSAEGIVYSPPSYGDPPSYNASPHNEEPPSYFSPPSYEAPEKLENLPTLDSPEELKEKLNFPESLQRLVIDGYLSEFGDNKTPIKLPSTLTNLTLTEVSNVDLDTLQNLTQLTNLVVRGFKGGDEFSYNLPSSLKSLEIIDHRIKIFHIIAPNLESLVIRGNLSGVVDESRFTFPASIKKLSLQGCRIDKLSIDFPDSLEWLDISMNNLKSIESLPSGLKYLDLSMNHFGSTNDVPTFPKQIETLNLSRNQVHDQWICKLDLPSLTKLKNLYMAEDKFCTLNIEGLPLSLVALDVHGGGVSSFIGDFKDLVNLEELDLSDNELSKHIKLLGGNYSKIFGKNVIYSSL